MSAVDANRKSRRTYDSSKRREHARQQYETTLVQARRLFLERGYAATTVEAIAQAAEVSPATIYKTYGGKAALVRSLCEQALAGDGPAPAETRADALRAGNDPRQLIEGWADLLAEVSPRISPLMLLLRAAAEVDREAADLLAEFDSRRRTRMTENAQHLADGGHLRNDVSIQHARDVLWFVTSPEFYELLVTRQGWSTDDLSQFAADTMSGALLTPTSR